MAGKKATRVELIWASLSGAAMASKSWMGRAFEENFASIQWDVPLEYNIAVLADLASWNSNREREI